MSAVIELDGLGVRFGRHQILKDLRGAFSGRAVGLLGPNGAGKTTLVHTLLGFHPASEGTARVFGHDIRTETKQIRALIGYMPENDAFIAGMSAVRLVRLMAELSGLPLARHWSGRTRRSTTWDWAKPAIANSRPTRWE